MRESRYPFIKVCGLASIDDIHRCASAGVNTVGLLLVSDDHPHRKRDQLVHSEVSELLGNKPNDVSIALLTKETHIQRLDEICRDFQPDYLQMQGNVAPADIVELAGTHQGVRLIKKMAISPESTFDQLSNEIGAIEKTLSVYAILLDTALKKDGRGGTGELHDWSLSSRIVHAHNGTKFILAGGLNPANVVTAIKEVRPWGVDAMSGVSRKNGVKDIAKVTEYAERALAAFGGGR